MIKAIETKYRGHLFRSRLEARWAVFFTALGVKWEYEKEGYELPDGTRYLPDFWLPHLSLWVEVKGQLTEREYQDGPYSYGWYEELDLAERFKDAQSWPIACLVGTPGQETIHFLGWDTTTSSGGSYYCSEGFWCFANGIITLWLDGRKDRTFVSDNLMGFDMPQLTFARDYTYDRTIIAIAYEYARMARFEYGQQPDVPPVESVYRTAQNQLLLKASDVFDEAEAAAGSFELDKAKMLGGRAAALLELARQMVPPTT